MLRIAGSLVVAAMLAGACARFDRLEPSEWSHLSAEISRLSAEGQQLAIDPEVDVRIAAIARVGELAVAHNDRSGAQAQVKALHDTVVVLSSEYDLRIVSRPGEDTGFFRQLDDAPAVRNHYIVVEAVAPGGGLVSVPQVNEETQEPAYVSKWGQRVSEETFNRIAADKSAHGILQNGILGRKVVGELEPRFDMPAIGGVVTEW